MHPCSCCFTDTLAKCETGIKLNIILPVYGDYRWVITDKFGHKYQGALAADRIIPVDELPAGLLTQYSGVMKLEIFEAGTEDCGPEKFLVAGRYDCIEFEITGGTFEKNNLGCEVECEGEPSYLEYIALMTQESGNDPVANVITNTLSGPIVWSYIGAGSYTGTLAGAFPENKTFVATSLSASSSPLYLARQSNNIVSILTLGDDEMNGSTFVNIRVYP